MESLPDALQPLGAYEQFICWRAVEKPNGKIDKIPVNAHTGYDASINDPDAQLSFSDASALAKISGYGIGFVFTERDPFFFLDIDGCLTPENKWNATADYLVSFFRGAAVEVSQSGRGLHIIGSLNGKPPAHGKRNAEYGLELYTSNRFVALTGTHARGTAAAVFDEKFTGLVESYFAQTAAADLTEWTDEPCDGWEGFDDDAETLKRALRAKSTNNIFGTRVTFKQLWNRDVDALAQAFPDPEREFDESAADAALAQHLAFWTGNNCERMQRLMVDSGLFREKHERADYLPRTILKACSQQKSFYQGNRKPAPDVLETPDATNGLESRSVAGYQYLTAELQQEYFKGCCYVQDAHRIFVPSGQLLKPEQFKATYGGYVFQIDDVGKATTKNAWEAFTESQVLRNPKTDTVCFRPENPSGAIVEDAGLRMLNVYVPVETRRVPGDASPMLEHLAKVLPVERDQEILLAYMAALVQNPGVKFQWCPLLQGVEGNGKTLFARIVKQCVGAKYTHMPKASEISEKFNEWLFFKLFIGIEDVYVPDHKREVIEILKPMITNEEYPMRAMHRAEIMGDNRANFMLNSNHKDAIRSTQSNRRFAVFYTAQQTKIDLARDGMGGDYFPKLYRWLKREDGFAICHNFLREYEVPDALNPATQCQTAPETSSTAEAVLSSLGAVEQEILEAVGEGKPGFADGWISSVALENLLHSIGATRSIPRNKRREMLQDLGYDWHPHLPDGRCVGISPLDNGGKPRLFIRYGHVASNLTKASDILNAYLKAQGYVGARHSIGGVGDARNGLE